MVRNLIAVVTGVLAGGMVVAILEGIGHAIFPPPPGLDVSNPQSLAGVMDQIPLGAKLAVSVAWALGSLAGGFLAAKMCGSRHVLMALLVGAVLLAGGGYTLVTIPHPVWMAALGVLVPLPMAWLGARIARPAHSLD